MSVEREKSKIFALVTVSLNVSAGHQRIECGERRTVESLIVAVACETQICAMSKELCGTADCANNGNFAADDYNLNVAIVGWNDTTARVSSVTDTKGNVYTLAVGPTLRSGACSQSI